MCIRDRLYSVLDLPSPPHKYLRYIRILSPNIGTVAKNSLKQAAIKAVQDNNGCNKIPVAFDSAWQKRANSLHPSIVMTATPNG